MVEKLKHKLPTYSKIDHLGLDTETLSELINCITELSNEFCSVFDANKEYLALHRLDKVVYDVLKEVCLTESSWRDENFSDLPDIYSENSVNNFRTKKELVTNDKSAFNELTYTEKTEVYNRYKQLFDKVLCKFKGKPTRIRIVKLESGKNLAPHIDYDPGYAVRIIIPIISDDECVNLFWVKNNLESVILKPGQAYFLNTGYKHAVMNFSNHDRYTFMISVAGSEDIDHLLNN